MMSSIIILFAFVIFLNILNKQKENFENRYNTIWSCFFLLYLYYEYTKFKNNKSTNIDFHRLEFYSKKMDNFDQDVFPYIPKLTEKAITQLYEIDSLNKDLDAEACDRIFKQVLNNKSTQNIVNACINSTDAKIREQLIFNGLLKLKDI